MNAFVLHDTDHDAGTVRWIISAAIIVALHAALVTLILAWYTQLPPPGVALPMIMIDLAPASSASSNQTMDLPPGPEIQQAEPPQPPPPEVPKPETVEEQLPPTPPPPPEVSKLETVEEQLAPTPPQPSPVVEAPPEQKPEPLPREPEPAKIVPAPSEPVPPPKPNPVHTEVKKKPSETPPAARSSAAPKAERRAPSTSAASPAAGATAAAALATYNQLVATHLQRFKQYPAASKAAGEQGVSRLSFTLGRGGQVLGSRLAGSSGHTALDGETLAMVRRAQPFPPMPPELKQASMSFTVPIRFSVR